MPPRHRITTGHKPPLANTDLPLLSVGISGTGWDPDMPPRVFIQVRNLNDWWSYRKKNQNQIQLLSKMVNENHGLCQFYLKFPLDFMKTQAKWFHLFLLFLRNHTPTVEMKNAFEKSKILLWANCLILPAVKFYLANTKKNVQWHTWLFLTSNQAY